MIVKFVFRILSSELSVEASPILLVLYSKTPNIKCEVGWLGNALLLWKPYKYNEFILVNPIYFLPMYVWAVNDTNYLQIKKRKPFSFR